MATESVTETQKKENKTKKQGFLTTGTGVALGLEGLLAVIGAVLVFVPGVKVEYLIYILCVALIIGGIYMIVRYFMTESFRNLNEYGFALGTLLVILGICGLVKNLSLTGVFFTGLGLLLLVSAVVKLQYTMDLRSTDNSLWIVALILTAVLTVCSILVVLNPFDTTETYHAFTRWVLLVDGILGVIMVIFLTFSLKRFTENEEKTAKRREERQKQKQADAEMKAEGREPEKEKTDLEKGDKKEEVIHTHPQDIVDEIIE